MMKSVNENKFRFEWRSRLLLKLQYLHYEEKYSALLPYNFGVPLHFAGINCPISFGDKKNKNYRGPFGQLHDPWYPNQKWDIFPVARRVRVKEENWDWLKVLTQPVPSPVSTFKSEHFKETFRTFPWVHSLIHSSIHPSIEAFPSAGVYPACPEHYLILDRLPDIWTGCKGTGSSHWKICHPLPEKSFLLILLLLRKVKLTLLHVSVRVKTSKILVGLA